MTHPTPEQIEADIAQQREELADTVSKLQSRLDVKAHAKARTEEFKHRVQDGVTTDEGKPKPAALAGGAVGATATVAGAIALTRNHHPSGGTMKTTLGMLAAGGAGYVLGTRAGRARYEQIATRARQVADSPAVRDKLHKAEEVAREKAPNLTDKVASKMQANGHGAHAATDPVTEPTYSGAPAQPGEHPQAGPDPTLR